MNLNDIYDLFYQSGQLSEKPLCSQSRKKQKKEFFIGSTPLIPYEIKIINSRLWDDKSRRSRFLANSSKEPVYQKKLKDELIKNPFLIARFEEKSKVAMLGGTNKERFEKVFLDFIDNHNHILSGSIITYLTNTQTKKVVEEYWNALAFLVLYAMLGNDVNHVYRNYLLYFNINPKMNAIKDDDRFMFEYPADGQCYKAGETIRHSWIIKNTGNVVWNKRFCECINADDIKARKSLNIPMADVIYPGETVELNIEFIAPEVEGAYELIWRMKNNKGEYTFPGKTGVGLHFTVTNQEKDPCSDAGYDFLFLEEYPADGARYRLGEMIRHEWKIKNTGTRSWKHYYFDCINAKALRYASEELMIPIKREIGPGEIANIIVEFVTPPDEGHYCLIWKMKNRQGKYVFPDKKGVSIHFDVY